MHMNQIRKLLKSVNALFGSDRELLAFLIGPLNAGSGEQIDSAVGDVLDGVFVIPSSTASSSKKFQLKVDDSGTITAEEVTE